MASRQTGNTVAGAGQGAFSGAAAGATIGSVVPGIGTAIGTAVGGIGGALLGGVMGYMAEGDDPEEALNRKLANENIKLSNEEKKIMLEQLKQQIAARKKIGQQNSGYMNAFFQGVKNYTPSGASTPISTAPTAAQRLAGVV